jgi:hypothetical protein
MNRKTVYRVAIVLGSLVALWFSGGMTLQGQVPQVVSSQIQDRQPDGSYERVTEMYKSGGIAVHPILIALILIAAWLLWRETNKVHVTPEKRG